jgi:hypothetical protein
MILNFQPQFVPYVVEGSKTHTIRAVRKDGRAPRVGETCHCYTGLRRKGPRLLGRWACVKVETIEICKAAGWNGPRVFIEGLILDRDELQALAVRDGFRKGGFAEMMEFWRGRLPFKGFIIHWRFSK